MWAGSLPALDRLRAKHGGRTVYDSRDVYMRVARLRADGRLQGPVRVARTTLGAARGCRPDGERCLCRPARRAIRIERPPVVRNTPDRYTPPSPRPDLIREALGLSPETRVVLYQGGLLSDRGIEQGMEAILDVPDAVLAIMGFGSAQAEIEALADSPRFRRPGADARTSHAGRTARLDRVGGRDVDGHPADERQPSFTTPQKLWEAIAAGVPVVATDLPGMAEIVRDTGCGVLVDATDPADIARGIRQIVDAPAEARACHARTDVARGAGPLQLGAGEPDAARACIAICSPETERPRSPLRRVARQSIDETDVGLRRMLPGERRHDGDDADRAAASRRDGSSTRARMASAMASASPDGYIATASPGKSRSTVGSRDATTGLPIAAYS